MHDFQPKIYVQIVILEYQSRLSHIHSPYHYQTQTYICTPNRVSFQLEKSQKPSV